MCSTVPERATMSVLLTPLLEKALRRPLRLLVGPGRSLLARDALAVVASLLPKGRTDHDGPPSCTSTFRESLLSCSIDLSYDRYRYKLIMHFISTFDVWESGSIGELSIICVSVQFICYI